MLVRVKSRLARIARRVSDETVSYIDIKRLVAVELGGLLSNDGVTPISAAMSRRIATYAKDRFGSVVYAPWLEFYATFRGEFVEGWVPDNFFQTVAVQRINGRYHLLDNARTLQARLVGPGVMPDIAHFVSGEWRRVDGERLNRDGIARTLFSDQSEICIKTEQSSKGRGVTLVRRADFDLDAVEALGNFVVQRVLQQSAYFSEIFPGAVATMRIATGKLPGAAPICLFSNLRLGRGSARIVTLGSIKVPIVDQEGSLGAFGSDTRWTRYRRHPDTDFRFEGAKIPNFAKARDHCIALHDRLPQFGFIGWDVTIDREGAVQLMELNTGFPGIKFGEMTVGPCFGPFDLEQYAQPRRKASSQQHGALVARPAAH